MISQGYRKAVKRECFGGFSLKAHQNLRT